jgi:hypothetical protein
MVDIQVKREKQKIDKNVKIVSAIVTLIIYTLGTLGLVSSYYKPIALVICIGAISVICGVLTATFTIKQNKDKIPPKEAYKNFDQIIFITMITSIIYLFIAGAVGRIYFDFILDPLSGAFLGFILHSVFVRAPSHAVFLLIRAK